MHHSYLLPQSNGRVVLTRELRQHLRLFPNINLFGKTLSDEIASINDELVVTDHSILLSPIPLKYWSRSFRACFATSSDRGALASILTALGDRGLNVVNVLASGSSLQGDLRTSVILEAPDGIIITEDEITALIECQCHQFLSHSRFYSHNSIDKNPDISCVSCNKLSYLSAYRPDANCPGGSLGHCSYEVSKSILDLKENLESGGPKTDSYTFLSNELEERRQSPVSALVAVDSEEYFIRIWLVPSRPIRRIDLTYTTVRAANSKTYTESFGGALATTLKHLSKSPANLNIYHVSQHLSKRTFSSLAANNDDAASHDDVANIAPHQSDTNEGVEADPEATSTTIDNPKARSTDTTHDSEDSETVDLALIAEVSGTKCGITKRSLAEAIRRACGSARKELADKGIVCKYRDVDIRYQEYSQVPVFVSHNLKTESCKTHIAFTYYLSARLRDLGLYPISLDISQGEELIDEIRELLDICPLVISMHYPNPNYQIKGSGTTKDLPTTAEEYSAGTDPDCNPISLICKNCSENQYPPSPWVMFEESYALSRPETHFCIRMRHKQVLASNYGLGRLERIFCDSPDVFSKQVNLVLTSVRGVISSDKWRRIVSRLKSDRDFITSSAIQAHADFESWLNMLGNEEGVKGTLKNIKPRPGEFTTDLQNNTPCCKCKTD